MDKITKLENDLTQCIQTAKDPVLCWSGGKDSTFLLHFIRKLGYNLPVLVFPHLWSEYQKTFIKEMVSKYKLTAFFYSPKRLDFTPPHAISFYPFQHRLLPVISDHIENTNRCGLLVGQSINLQAPIPYYHWDKTIIGSKKVDTHPLIKNLNFDEFEVETPLWDWTDNEVLSCTRDFKFEYDTRVYDLKDETADTGNFVACMRCFGSDDVFCPKEGKIISGIYGNAE